METNGQLAPLLGVARSAQSNGPTYGATQDDSNPLDYESDDEEELLDMDEPTLDLMMAKFGTSVGSLGLGGAMQGVPLMRRGSVSAATRPTNPTIRRYSRTNADDLPYRSRRKSNAASVREYENRRGSFAPRSTDDPLNTVDESEGSINGSLQAKSRGKYLGGVSDARFWAIFSSILLVYFVACFDSTLMASSHPVITSYFHSSNSASWLSTSFLLTSTAFQPMFGRISDTIGRKEPFILSLAVFAIGTIWCAMAPDILSFIFARAVCGFGAGGAMAMGAIINSDLVPLEIRGSYQSLLNLAFGIGSSLGAALGGFLADALGWRWEFGIQVPAIILATVVAFITTPNNLGPQLAKTANVGILQTIRGFDLLGSFLLTTSVTFLIVAMNLGGNIFPWSDPIIVVAFIVAFVCGAFLIRAEKKAKRPIMPLEFLFSSPRGNLVFSNFFASMTMNTILFNLPLYFQAVLLDTPTRSGTRLVLPFVFNMAAGFSTGFIITYSTRLRPTLLLGYSLMVVGSILLSVMRKSLPEWAYTQFIVASSMGQGFSYPSVSLSMLATSTVADLAVATSTLILWRSLGTIMGVAVSSLIFQNALVYYLDTIVQGPLKDEVIHQARRSIESVALLPEPYQGLVIDAYSASLRWTFIFATVTSALALILVIRIRLPKLTQKVEVPSSGE